MLLTQPGDPTTATGPGAGNPERVPPAVPEGGVGLYVHWPFCRKKCPYCDFNSHVREAVDHAAWADALVADLTAKAAGPGPTGPLTSIFFGGGTPSLMAPETVARIVEAASTAWGLAPDCEITLEANPTSVEADRFAGFRAAGVNRVSLGVQALNDTDLTALGREHSAAEALAAVRLARRTFDRVSFDLIYARPDQTADAWAAELDRALGEGPDHLSVYQLTVEPGTRFALDYNAGRLTVPDEETASDLFAATQDRLTAAGLPAYEVSNHAVPGQESRHNLTYWRSGDYIGVGPGAHGRLTVAWQDGVPHRVATRAHRAPEVYLERVAATGTADREADPIPPADAAEEALLMGLRLAEGIPLTRLETLAGRPWHRVLDSNAVDRLVAGGFVENRDRTLRATPDGLARLNAVIAALVRVR